MHLSKFLLFLTAAAGAGATFMPWKQVSQLGENRIFSGRETPVVLETMQIGDGWLTLGLFLLILVLALVGNRRGPLKGAKAVVIVLLSLTIATLCVYDINQLNKRSDSPALLQELTTVSTASYGLDIALVASLVTILLTLLSRRIDAGAK